LLKRALAIDPDYAPAEAAIGWSRVHQISHGRSPVSEADAAEAVALARQALEIGKDDPDTLWMAATTLHFFAGEHAVAAAAIDRALMLNPNSAHAWAARGSVCRNRDQPGPAVNNAGIFIAKPCHHRDLPGRYRASQFAPDMTPRWRKADSNSWSHFRANTGADRHMQAASTGEKSEEGNRKLKGFIGCQRKEGTARLHRPARGRRDPALSTAGPHRMGSILDLL
jgi:tetratricopeptide (TPR) repeat protein